MYIDSSHSELISALKWSGGNRDHGEYTTVLSFNQFVSFFFVNMSEVLLIMLNSCFSKSEKHRRGSDSIHKNKAVSRIALYISINSDLQQNDPCYTFFSNFKFVKFHYRSSPQSSPYESQHNRSIH